MFYLFPFLKPFARDSPIFSYAGAAILAIFRLNAGAFEKKNLKNVIYPAITNKIIPIIPGTIKRKSELNILVGLSVIPPFIDCR